ncbi:class I SAM-dependent methyltransferase [Nocardia farcinica]|uniref:class I SAM-dependent methyltransferase n=1 Tax=Nocardia farcinica TaxID=37329 RepID=UPI002454BCCB|nr:class I SAM-dependent methyltransferase [Nocardia farcinica]
MAQDDRFTRAFDTAGSDFDRLGVHLWNPIGSATVAATAPRPGERVLDACCGTGASALPAARAVGAGGHVDAVDLSAALIGELARHAAELPQVRTHVADATTWPHDGYDVVQAVLGVFFFPDMAAGTEHLISRARPGGRVGCTIWRRGSMVLAGKHLGNAIAAVTGTPVRERPEHPVDRIDNAEAFGSWFTERGLSDVTVVEHPLRLALTPELAWLIVTGSGFVGALADLDPDQVAAVHRRYLDSLAAAGVTDIDATTLIGVGTRVAANSPRTRADTVAS